MIFPNWKKCVNDINICSGYILWGISIFSFRLPMIISAATIGVSLTIVLDCVMTFFGSTANDAAFNAWLTDSTDSSNRGATEGIIKELYNHPCVCYYTIFNEGWGQFEADQCYADIKAMDATRIFDTTSGWFRETLSDVDSEHIYFKPVQLKPRQERPMVLSEFGGYSCKIEDHAFNLDKTYGYRYFSKREDFEQAMVELYEKEILPQIPKGLCATVLTQVSDVEDETNGLLTYDRQVLKVNPEVMKEIAERMQFH